MPQMPPSPPKKSGRAGAGAFIVILLGLLAAAGVVAWRRIEDKKAREAEQKQLTAGSDRDATTPVTNEAYRFRLDPPGERWKVLNEEEALQLNADALAGGVYVSTEGGFMWLVNFCEKRGENEDLTVYGRRLARFVSVEVEAAEPVVTTHHGLPAVQIEAESAYGGQAVWLAGRAFRRDGGYICSAVTVGFPPGPTIKSEAAKALDAMVPLEGEIVDKPRLPPPDDQGVGWRRRDGVYYDAATGAKLSPPEGCRVVGGQEAHGNQSLARALYTCRTPDFSVAVNQWRDDGEDPKRWPPVLGELAAEEYEATDERLKVTAHGQEVELFVAEDAVEGDEVLGAGVFLGRGRYLQLSVYYSPSARAEVLKRLGPVLEGMTLMEETERSELARTLAGRAPPGITGVDQHYHDRRYLDFASGLRWEHDRGPWMVRIGSDAAMTRADSRMWAYHPGTDVEIAVQAFPNPEPDFHAQAVARLKDEYFAAAEAQPPQTWGAVEVRLSKLPSSYRGRNQMWVATAVVDGVGNLVSMNVADNLEGDELAAAKKAFFEGFSFVRPVPRKDVLTGLTFRDFVASLSLTVPSGLLEQKADRTEGGVQYVWSRGSRTLGLVVGSLGEGNNEFLRNLLAHSVAGIFAGLTKSRAEYGQTEIAGFSAKHIHFDGRPHDVEIWHFVDAGELIVVFTHLPEEEAEAVKNSLKRLASD